MKFHFYFFFSALHQFVEPLKDKIHQEVAHRLTACDTLLKDNISKAVKSRVSLKADT